MSRNFTPDESLVDRLLLDDTQAFEELHRRYCFYLYSYCVGKLNTPADAKRIVRQIFIDLWENRHSLPVRFSISMHLYSCVRKAVVACLHEKLNGEQDWPALNDQIIPGFQVEKLQQARLPVRFDMHHKSQEEVAVKAGSYPSFSHPHPHVNKPLIHGVNIKSLKYAFQRVLQLW